MRFGFGKPFHYPLTLRPFNLSNIFFPCDRFPTPACDMSIVCVPITTVGLYFTPSDRW